MYKVTKKKEKGLIILLMLCLIGGLLVSEQLFAQRGSGGTTVIDPPPGAAFKDPVTMPNLSTQPGVVRINLEVKNATVNINGTNATLMTYNGYFPGPVIKVKKGDYLYIDLKNSLPYTAERNMLGFEKNHTNLHTHGWHVSPEPPADDAHIDIPAGGTYAYAYDLSRLEPSNLSFYHAHVHGTSAEEYWSGMVGALVTEDETDLLAAYETHLMILKDISLSGGLPTPHTMMMDYMHGKEGDIIMVNGQVNPVLTCRPGQVQRWRILNASNARFYKLSLANHTLQLIGTDGGLLDKPYPVQQLLLSPGERADVLVKVGPTAGSYKFLSLPYARMGMGGMGGGGMGGGGGGCGGGGGGGCSCGGGCGGRGGMQTAQITLLTLKSAGAALNNTLPAVINPNAKRLNIDTGLLTKRTLTLSMGQGRGYINGQDFDVDPYMIMSEVGMYEVWEIINQSGMDHPFHQHVNAAQVLGISGGDADYAALYTQLPARKDTVLVPRFGSVKLLVPVMDYTGMTMFHCHILEHEDIGMMGMWHLMMME